VDDEHGDGDERTDTGGRLQCHASVPLSVGERHLGMLNVASRDWRVLSDAELSLLTTAGALVSLAVERSRLEAAGVRAIAAEERNRLAREIHDTLAQGLAALTMQLEVADSLATGQRDSDARLETAVGRALELARSTLGEARRSVLDLREAPLEGRSLEDALASIAADARLGSPRGPTIDVKVDAATAPEIPAAVEQGLYRIAQQAGANSVRHAGAARVAVRLTWSPDAVGLRVEDDGDGFDPTAVPGDRFGLVGMQERARLLGGTLRVESAPGAGTAIDVRIPIGVRPAQSGGGDT
jgi:two-component system, NarL family, sensor kinase